jgi:hypothetical protein
VIARGGSGGGVGAGVVETDRYSVGETDNVGSPDGYIDMVGDIETLVDAADSVVASE